MIIDITETIYKGFMIELVKDNGWKIVLNGEEIMFRYFQDAQTAIDDFYREILPRHNGKPLKKK